MLHKTLTIESVRATEAAAVASAKMRGMGDEKAADQAAVDAMRQALNQIDMDGTVVIGEGERDEAPMLFIGEKVGTNKGQAVDIALDPLEGTTLCAKALPNSLSVIAFAEKGALLHAPDCYMEKIAIGPGYPEGTVALDRPLSENLKHLAKAKGVSPDLLVVCILERPRHADLIAQARALGARVYLIPDGDVAGVMHTASPSSPIDLYVGTGGAPEGVLAAAALRCIGGQMQGRLILKTEEEKERARKMGILDPQKIFKTEEMASGDVLFAATGVTDGALLKGVEFLPHEIVTSSLVMRSTTGTVRYIENRMRRK